MALRFFTYLLLLQVKCPSPTSLSLSYIHQLHYQYVFQVWALTTSASQRSNLFGVQSHIKRSTTPSPNNDEATHLPIQDIQSSASAWKRGMFQQVGCVLMRMLMYSMFKSCNFKFKNHSYLQFNGVSIPPPV